jgi:hypothetical protein
MTAFALPLVDGFGTIRRDVGVRLLNISMSGCLLEIAAALPLGLVGTLHVTIGTTEYSDLVRVVRCQSVAGAGERHRIGVQFVWADVPAERSLRRAAWGGPFAATANGGSFRLT